MTLDSIILCDFAMGSSYIGVQNRMGPLVRSIIRPWNYVPKKA